MSERPLSQRIARGELAAFDDPELPLALLVEPNAAWLQAGLHQLLRRAIHNLAVRWAHRRSVQREPLLRALDQWAEPWRRKLVAAGGGDSWPARRNVIRLGFSPVHCAAAISDLPPDLVSRSPDAEDDLLQMRLGLLHALRRIEPDETAEAGRALAVVERYVGLG